MPELTSDTPVPPSELEPQSKESAEAAAEKASLRRALRPKIRLTDEIRPHEIFALVGGFAILALLIAEIILYPSRSTYSVVHPVFPFGALLFFLYPFRREVVARRTMQLGGVAFGVWMFSSLAGVLFPFFVAFTVAYIFAPLVRKLDLLGVPRVLTAIVTAVAIIGIYALVGIFIIPALVGQFRELLSSGQGLLKGANSVLDQNKLASQLTKLGFSASDAKALVAQHVQPQLQQMVAWVFSWIGDFLKNVTTILEGILNLVLIPFLTLYMMIDFGRIRKFIRTTLLRDDPNYVYYVKRIDTILNSYFRGILLTSSMVGTMAVIVLSIFGVPYAILIGIMTGLLNLIPTIGMFMNLGLAMLIYAFASQNFLYDTVVTAALIFSLHAVNSNLIEPRILGDRVGIHPVMVLLSLFIFGQFLGFIGLLIAVPTSAVILMFIREWYNRSLTLNEPVIEPPAEPVTT